MKLLLYCASMAVRGAHYKYIHVYDREVKKILYPTKTGLDRNSFQLSLLALVEGLYKHVSVPEVGNSYPY